MMLLPSRRKYIENIMVRLDMYAGISTLISYMELQERKLSHFLIKSKMIPHFLTYEKEKVVEKGSKNYR
jgi:hypothetical protein